MYIPSWPKHHGCLLAPEILNHNKPFAKILWIKTILSAFNQIEIPYFIQVTPDNELQYVNVIWT